MPDRCIQCHQAQPEVDIGVLHIRHSASPLGSETPPWSLSRQHYCAACYRHAEQDQHRQQLAKLWMALLPMGWFLVSGTLIYGILYPDPATAPIEAHLFFFGTLLAAFYAIPATIYHRFKRLNPMPETLEAASAPVTNQSLTGGWVSATGNCAIRTSSPSAPASSGIGSESADT
ncbi:hypothetical protein [Candidatus Entotheonella palauensis]|uniref:hypothetical protein n=1 Tax=Candidatus Entotheonella palauensis TaxID=93172 RepID=UPI0011776ED1|nr:hypothetical protein [Candidatus Entotheonella palauensis]